ncbi:DUF4388 domain-containing protein [Deinococcus sp. SDU3-2]|uniref:DUF4388 domain-containing protein n=1 Tax=Deinococcus terrestris TaxID=2651870 RepID=A0A7X1NUK1_9DEIO|nr:DUF4388 domain-containing protein [Deinococcus terrestris]MPY65779.1 DUF4388 domain-containing protein [Deinococcus terrestris]
MQGLLSDLPLLGILELVHTTRQTGVLDVKTEVPFTVAFAGGEIVGGGILDWLGTDAIQAAPLLPSEGSFEFAPRAVEGAALSPYEHFTTDWARASDEWAQLCGVIGSPSRVFRGERPLFDGGDGASVRTVARQTGRPLFDVAQEAAAAVQAGQLSPTGRFAWFSLRLLAGTRRIGTSAIADALDGERTLGDLTDLGHSVDDLRAYLLAEVRAGLRFPGSGWVLRDLIWEGEHLGS